MRTILLMAFVFFISCNAPLLSGEITKETRDLSPFSSINLSISANVYLTQGPVQKVEIEGDKNILGEIETVVEGNKLKIKTRDVFHGNFGNISIYITIPEIEDLSVSGSGDITAKSALKSDEMDMDVSGSGSIRLHALNSNEVSATITGSGDISISAGKATRELELVITGSGSFAGENFEAAEADVDITGSGSAKVWAINELETNITGSGDVNYRGNPKVNANSTGSGKTHSMQ